MHHLMKHMVTPQTKHTIRVCLEPRNVEHRNCKKCTNRKGMSVQIRGIEKDRKAEEAGVWNTGIRIHKVEYY
jgi:hypothetical protein